MVNEQHKPRRKPSGMNPVLEPTPWTEGPASTGVAAFFGTWPGDETEAELLDALKRID